MTQTNKLQDLDKQTIMADDCFLQALKPSVFQNHVFETKVSLPYLYFSHNMLLLCEPRRVLVIWILFLDCSRFAIGSWIVDAEMF